MLVLLSAPITTPPLNSTATRVVPVDTWGRVGEGLKIGSKRKLYKLLKAESRKQTFRLKSLTDESFGDLLAPGEPVLGDGLLGEAGEVLQGEVAGHPGVLGI